MLWRFFIRGGWIAGGRSLVDAKRRSFDRAESGDASATPEASRFAFVSERTSSLACRAPAASFIVAGGALLHKHQGHFGFQAHKCQIDAATKPKIETQHRNEILTHPAKAIGARRYFFFGCTAKTRKTPWPLTGICRYESNVSKSNAWLLVLVSAGPRSHRLVCHFSWAKPIEVAAQADFARQNRLRCQQRARKYSRPSG